MKLNVYSIFDTATGAYNKPFYGQADNWAIRVFSDLCTAADSEISKHPSDYSLVRTATWDDQNCHFNQENVTTLITGLEAVAASQKVPAAPNDLQ